MTNSTRCLATYHGICVNQDGSLDPCCQYTRDRSKPVYQFFEFDQYQKDTQQTMHNDAEAGIKHTGCSKCWTEEAAGWTSLRQWFDRWYLQDASTEINKSNPLYDIELRLGNFCNLNCFMCHPGASSSVATERNAHKQRFKDIGISVKDSPQAYFWEQPEFEKFNSTLFKDARRVNITGGEPFIIPAVLDVLDQLMEKRDTVSLTFNTNLTRVGDRLLQRLEKFKNIIISVSLEGVESMNDYLRYPSKWNEIVKNFETVKTRLPQANLTVNHTFQHSSVYALPGLAEFCVKNNLEMQMTTVQGDDRLTLRSVWPEHLQQFATWAESTTLLNTAQKQLVINLANSTKFDSELQKQYFDYVDLLDQIRGTDYYKVFKVDRLS